MTPMPKWFRPVAVIALLWNLLGCFAYLMDVTMKPEDIAKLSQLLVTGPGTMAEVPPLTFKFLPLSGFSTAANSKVPHNALHDARALRDHVLTLE